MSERTEQATSTRQGGESNPVDSTGLCLLSLDGGGVRGLSTLYVLKGIMDRLNHDRKTNGNFPPLKPCEVFDLIGGTSTGGLIAIMLGRLQMDVDQCITAYNDLAESVFGEKLSRIPFSLMGRTKARFDSKKLESAIRKIIIASGIPETELLNEKEEERGCKIFVCTVDRYTKNIIRLRSYVLPDEPNTSAPATILKAALATSAATTFFEPVSIGNRSFADGGLGANNPVNQVEGEASDIWCSQTADLKPLVKCFISIGTGNPGTKPFEDNVVKLLSKTVVEIATDTQNTEREFIARWRVHYDENRYFRFNVEQGLQAIGLHEYEKKGPLEAATEGYLSHQAQKFRVRDCVQNLRQKQHKTTTSFELIVQKYSIQSYQRHRVKEPHWIVPFEKNIRFVGRETQLQELGKKLFVKDVTAKVAIHGLGGVGKTALILELLQRIRKSHPNCSIIWIPTTNMESAQQAYLNVAKKLGIPGWDEKDANVKKLVQEYLSEETAGQWLLVFDNADDKDMWFPRIGSTQNSDHLIDYLPKSTQGSIVFTSRNKKLALKLGARELVDVKQMDESVAKKLLQNYLIDQELVSSQQETEELLEKLTCLPLAIVQAAAYMNENSIGIAEYLKLLNKQDSEVIALLSRGFEDEGRYRDPNITDDLRNPVATTWLISFEQIKNHHSLAADYLSFMACVDPKDVPLSLLPPGSIQEEETDAVGTLIAYSFVTKHGQLLDIHRLVHLATRNWLQNLTPGKDQLAQWSEWTIEQLSYLLPRNEYDANQNRDIWRGYLTHTRYALDCSPSLVSKDWEARIGVVWGYGICLMADGRYRDAEALLVEVVDHNKRVLGCEDLNTLSAMTDLASIRSDAGRWKEAEELQVVILEANKRVLGLEHPRTLDEATNLASSFSDQGRYKEAEELQVVTLEAKKRVLGPEHPSVLVDASNLATSFFKRGRYKEAEELQIVTLEANKRVLGPEHPRTLDEATNLASSFSDQGRYKEAEELQVVTLEAKRRVLGPEHPRTLDEASNLALSFCGQDRYKEAEELQVVTLEAKKRGLGPEHPSTLREAASLATSFFRQGRLKEAENLGAQILHARERILGHEHPDTLYSKHFFAYSLKRSGRCQEAIELMEECASGLARIVGADHPDTLHSHAALRKWETEEAERSQG